ncbi:DNA excision repair protein ERCC-5 homolog isoform X2 [Triplophysa dalaica]|uniref:DNA excision repair protein ERCC-5 homolog isoform X2 n=1 Tax=Triplophysa dalaica TaxID=1582913 RepID=UPI0024DFC6DC|nr:DNA excision repair protein ERCC-5 homolog isoform X2 [Triplophysa dalaica]
MGVHGLWKLVESTGKPINPETLEGKILAVDISIWLNQAVKGVRDRDGNSVQNAHLLTLFHRLCKLLFFRIKPIFVYDGDAPLLKKQTLALRRQRREDMTHESKQTNEKLFRTFLKRQAIKAALGDSSQEAIPSLSSVRRDEADDMYVLPALPIHEEKEQSSSEEEMERDEDESVQPNSRFHEIYENPDAVDINSEEFSLMPPEVKHEILKEMKEFSKRRRTLHHKPPECSSEFSQYQLAGLLHRNNLNQRLEGVEQEMSHHSSGGVEQQFGKGKQQDVEVRRLVSEDSSHYILIKGSQKRADAVDSQPTPALWSSTPWERKERPKGKPEPLWKPIADDENNPSSSSEQTESQQLSEGAPPSPRTLQAIQSAMMDSSSDDDNEAITVRSHDTHNTTGTEDKDGSASPRTLRAIQSAMMDDSERPKNRKYIMLSSSEDEEKPIVADDRGIAGDGGVSPRTLLGIQEALGDCGHEEQKSLTEREKTEIKSTALQSNDQRKDISCLTPDVSSRTVSSTPHVLASRSQPKSPEDRREPEWISEDEKKLSASDQKQVNVNEKVQLNREIVVKTEEESSSSEESFIEVYDVEEPRTKAEEQSANRSTSDDVDVKEAEEEKEETEEEDLSAGNISQMKASENEPAVEEWNQIDVEELEQLERDLQEEQTNLKQQQQQQERTSSTVTGQMCQESQELLRLFGVPFIVAPTEAEAQCATLDHLDQTHGTITDDSDIWLFGGRQVYKNFFNQNKYVEHYQCTDMQNQLGLDRTKLINLAYLLGSDYTEGISGVGYVTGMEILNEFPGTGLQPLYDFSNWWSEVQEKKKVTANPKDTKVKKKLRDLQLHPGFPNPVVAQAYLHPTVDQSDTSFSWGRPQLDLLKEFCASRFGWNSKKTEEILQPVLKQFNAQQTQLRIDSFFRLEQQERQCIRSQRLRRAVTCLKRKEREEEDDEEPSPSKAGKDESGIQLAPLSGGFIGSSADVPEETTLDGKAGGVTQDRKQVMMRAESSSSSSEDEAESGRSVAMVVARSAFEGKTRGRGKRTGGRGRGKNKS